MTIEHLYLDSFPVNHMVTSVDVVSLYHEGRFDELDKVVVCKDSHGNTIATFGEEKWDCRPFSRKKDKSTISTKLLKKHPELQREEKLLVYGWLFNRNTKQRRAVSFATIQSRFIKINMAYQYLAQNNYTSLQALSQPSVWESFKEYLMNKGYAQDSIEKCFIAINSAIDTAGWHQIPLGFTNKIESKKLAKELSEIKQQQTFVIPERLCDAIYGKAIELVEEAHPHRNLIAQTEKELQANYQEGKRIVYQNIKNGSTYTFILGSGKTDKHKLASLIKEYKPQMAADIIGSLAIKLPNRSLENGMDYKKYLSRLVTACYIICGGFSGMRYSELDKLTPDSYYKDTFEGRDYHMLQSHTFKLGEKRETWVTASVSKIAIELMSTLTEQWRNEVDYPDEKYTNSFWINRTARSNPPVLITSWNHRLQRFCEYFGFVVTEDDYRECLESNPKSQDRIKTIVKVGSPWPLRTHQFRRTLAFYCIKNRFGTLVALKQQFKHMHLSMTEWYTNGGKLASLKDLSVDKRVQAQLDNINAETTANKIFKQWHSGETLSGSHGKVIMKMREDVPTIYSSWDVIYRAVKDGKLTLHGSAHSYCKSGYDCDMDGVVTPQFCVDCRSGSSIIDEQQAKWWQKKHESLVAYMESGEDLSISERSHYITQIRAAENVMKDFDMEFCTFEIGLQIHTT